MSGLATDVIVLGLGGMGSATACELARRGARVVGFDQFTPTHEKGSSHGRTRIIRTAYYEHPDYVPMCRATFAGWYRLEQEVGRHLLTECPCLSVGPAGCEIVEGVQSAAQEHRLAVERLDSTTLAERYPMFRIPSGEGGIVEHSSGFLAVEACVQAHLEQAMRLGAELRFEEAILSWEARHDAVVVHTDESSYFARKLVITAGPWAGKVLASLPSPPPLTIMRQVALWFEPRRPDLFRRDRFPVFLVQSPFGQFYGLPMIDGLGVKIAQHYGAEELRSPEEVNGQAALSDETPVRNFVKHYLPDADGILKHASVCRYTLTPDRHFILDRHPTWDHVVLGAGFSGHGFKFAPVVGAILADLALLGKTEWPLELFRLGRFGSAA